jgi:hypothetical protein
MDALLFNVFGLVHMLAGNGVNLADDSPVIPHLTVSIPE